MVEDEQRYIQVLPPQQDRSTHMLHRRSYASEL